MNVPTYTQISDDPELASLAILDTALLTTRNSLHAHLPELGDSAPWHGEGLPEQTVLLAAMLVQRISELRDLVDLYRRINDAQRALTQRWTHEDDEIF